MLSREEGWCSFPYRDTRGLWTIGCGHLIDSRKGGQLPEYIRAFPLVDDDILRVLNDDIDVCIGQLNRYLPWWHRLTDRRKHVLISMVFQLGISGVLAFRRMIEALEKEDYSGAAKEMQDSKWAEQTPGRVDRMAAMMLAG